VQTFTGGAGTFTHQYAIVNGVYDISVAVTDEDGTFAMPGGVQVTAQLDTPQQAVVSSLFMGLIGQSINLDQLALGTAIINTPGGYETVLNILLNSLEHRLLVVNDLYQEYLGRDATEQELIQGVNILATQGLRATEVAILSSDTFFTQAGGNNAAYVNALYLAVFGAPAPAGDVSLFAAQLTAADALGGQMRIDATPGQTLTRAELAERLLTSPLGVLVEMDRDFKTYLGRDVDAVSYQIAAPILEQSPDAFLSLLFGSPQYIEAALNPPAA
jgi:hypothetical protein